MNHWTRPPAAVAKSEQEQEWTTLVTAEDDALASNSRSGMAWNALWHDSHEATAFQHRAWLAAWWAAYGQPGGLRLILVHHRGTPVAGAALYLAPHDPLRRLRPVGNGLSDYGDVLLTGNDRAGGARRLAAALAALRRPIDLRETAAGSAASELVEFFPHRTAAYPDSTCMELSACDWQDALAALPHRTAVRFKGKARKIDQLGVHVESASPAEASAAVDVLLRLHREQWLGRGINPEHLTARYGAMLRSAVPELIADGCGDLLLFSVGGETVACDLLFYWENTVAAYLNGVSPHMRHQIDYSTLFVREALNIVERRGAKTYTFLRGCEPYKLHWRPTPRVNQRLVLAGSRTAALATTALSTTARARVAASRSVRALRQRADHR